MYLQRQDLLTVLSELQDNRNGENDFQIVSRSLEVAIDNVEGLQHCLAGFDNGILSPEEAEICGILCYLYDRFFEHLSHFADLLYNTDERYQSRPGRPRVHININQVNGLKDLGFSWLKIADMIGVSERTLQRRRKESNEFLPSRSEISAENLRLIVREIIESSPNSGERMIIGALRSRSIHVARWKVREAVQDVDPIGKLLRSQTRRICRREYRVPCPNALW